MAFFKKGERDGVCSIPFRLDFIVLFILGKSFRVVGFTQASIFTQLSGSCTVFQKSQTKTGLMPTNKKFHYFRLLQALFSVQ